MLPLEYYTMCSDQIETIHVFDKISYMSAVHFAGIVQCCY